MTVNWRGSEVLAKIKGATVLGLVRGTEIIREEAVTLINTGAKTGRVYRRNGVSHQASAPGESPAADTGDLASKIGTSVDANALEGSVEFYSAHARPLEYGTRNMAPRPYARVAVAHKAGEITKDMADEIGKALR
jgi:HK97 gp10 family phage protein